MGKLEAVDGKISNWIGLWWHPEINCFTSPAINLSELKNFKGVVRLYMRKNKFFKDGLNGRPNYNFCLRDVSSEKTILLEMDDIEREVDDDERLYTREEVERVKRGACMDGQRGYYPGDCIIEDYI